MIKKISFIFFLTAVVTQTVVSQQPLQDTEGWDRFKRDIPEWLKDAKFGIYFHWGVYNVPAYNSEWYSRTMYVPGTGPYRHQLDKYGSLKNFGYKDFVPLFKAPAFNADEWADLFVRAGAKFGGSIAEHADGFSMWGSKVNPWNAKDMGPQKDIVGEMESAIRKRNLKFLTTFHHQWQWGWYPTFDSSVDAHDPKYAGLYGPVVSKAAWQHRDTAERPDAAFCRQWADKVEEVITRYKPDLLYFDSRLGHIQAMYRKEILAEYYGKGESAGQRILLYKGKDIPDSIGIRTSEKTRLDKLNERLWLTEEPISTYSWSYTEDMVIRKGEDILKGMIDIVSKNGVFLLNISPKADGTIPQNQKKVLLTIGDWLKKYGEAIYKTRPWYTFGEGPQNIENQKNEKDRRKYFELKYTANDIRYTVKGNIIYAIFLGSPEEGKAVLLQSFNKEKIQGKSGVKTVSMLGSKHQVTWQYVSGGLSLKMPANPVNDLPVVFKIEMDAGR